METAQRMIAPGGHKAVHGDAGLVAEVSHQLVQGITLVCLGSIRIPAKVGDRLEMDAPDTGNIVPGKGDQLPQIVRIHTTNHCGHKGHTDTQIRAVADGLLFGFQKGSAPERFVS